MQQLKWRYGLIGASLSEPHIDEFTVEFLYNIYIYIVRRAVSHFQLLFCEFLRHSLILKLFTNGGCIQSVDWTTGLDYWTGLLDWTTGLLDSPKIPWNTLFSEKLNVLTQLICSLKFLPLPSCLSHKPIISYMLWIIHEHGIWWERDWTTTLWLQVMGARWRRYCIIQELACRRSA